MIAYQMNGINIVTPNHLIITYKLLWPASRINHHHFLISNRFKWGWGSGLKCWKYDFGKMVEPKGPSRSICSIFLVGFWASRPFSASCAATPIFPQKTHLFKISTKITISHPQSIDGLLSSHKKFQSDWPKSGRVIAEKRMPYKE